MPAGQSLYDPRALREDAIPGQRVARARALRSWTGTTSSRKAKIIIVDEFTGRLMHGRRFSEGLHQAIEAKEGRAGCSASRSPSPPLLSRTTSACTRNWAGMTGTAMTEAEEFGKIYNLDVYGHPDATSPVVRADYADQIYKTAGVKVARGRANEIRGTAPVRASRSLSAPSLIETSEMLSEMLKPQAAYRTTCLNAKQHETGGRRNRASRVASGTVTIATNMAGRGVDILLGGNPDGASRASASAVAKAWTWPCFRQRRSGVAGRRWTRRQRRGARSDRAAS